MRFINFSKFYRQPKHEKPLISLDIFRAVFLAEPIFLCDPKIWAKISQKALVFPNPANYLFDLPLQQVHITGVVVVLVGALHLR